MGKWFFDKKSRMVHFSSPVTENGWIVPFFSVYKTDRHQLQGKWNALSPSSTIVSDLVRYENIRKSFKKLASQLEKIDVVQACLVLCL